MEALATYFLPEWRARILADNRWDEVFWQSMALPVTIPDGPLIELGGSPYQPRGLAFIFVTIPCTHWGSPLVDVGREMDNALAHWYRWNPQPGQRYEKGVTRL